MSESAPDLWSVEEVETRITRLSLASERSSSFELPVKLTGAHLSGLAATMQYLATWSYLCRHEVRHLILTGAAHDMTATELAEVDHVLIASLFADVVVDTSGRDITEDLRRASSVQLVRLDGYADLASERLLALSDDAFDGFQSSRIHRDSEFEKQIDLAAMNDVADLLISSSVAASAGRLARVKSGEKDRDGDRTTRQAFTDLLFELTDNTHVHGRQRRSPDDPGRREPIERSVRFLRVVRILADTGVLKGSTRASTPLGRYVSRSLPSLRKDPDAIGIYEITFFDSGEGLAYWMTDPSDKSVWQIPFQAELEATAMSLVKSQGARSERFFRSGEGIYSAMDALSRLGGFVRVRTGRLSLYRDFAREPLGEDEGGPLFDDVARISFFRDWTHGREISEASPVRGTAYSIFIPAERLAGLS